MIQYGAVLLHLKTWIKLSSSDIVEMFICELYFLVWKPFHSFTGIKHK